MSDLYRYHVGFPPEGVMVATHEVNGKVLGYFMKVEPDYEATAKKWSMHKHHIKAIVEDALGRQSPPTTQHTKTQLQDTNPFTQPAKPLHTKMECPDWYYSGCECKPE